MKTLDPLLNQAVSFGVVQIIAEGEEATELSFTPGFGNFHEKMMYDSTWQTELLKDMTRRRGGKPPSYADYDKARMLIIVVEWVYDILDEVETIGLVDVVELAVEIYVETKKFYSDNY